MVPMVASNLCSCLKSSFLLPTLQGTWTSMKQVGGGNVRRQKIGSLPTTSVLADYNMDSMSFKGPRRENVNGDFYVDHSCINCDVCRWMAPNNFSKVGDKSAVCKQPETESEEQASLQAMLSCPTASIHVRKAPKDIASIHASFPLPIHKSLPGVFHCGYHSKKSYGATSYFIQRPDGNILVDSPRYTESLAHKLSEMGGVKYLFLTHRDDVADQGRWAARFKSIRIIHSDEVEYDTSDAEMTLKGTGPWNLGADVELVFTPGHTQGSVCLLYKPLQVLFTGDHLCFSEESSNLSMMRRVNWYSVPIQITSIKMLLPLEFTWILPGHGRRFMFESLDQKNLLLEKLVAEEEDLLSIQRL